MAVFSPVSVLAPISVMETSGIGMNTKLPTMFFLCPPSTVTKIRVNPNAPNAHPWCPAVMILQFFLFNYVCTFAQINHITLHLLFQFVFCLALFLIFFCIFACFPTKLNQTSEAISSYSSKNLSYEQTCSGKLKEELCMAQALYLQY